jgi:5'-3' exonuclease
MTTQFMPSKVFFVWEKGGGSARRKKLYPEYKANRTTHGAKDVNSLKATMKKAVEVDVEKKESSSDSSNTLFLRQTIDERDKIRQLLLLTSAIKHLPVCQVYQGDSEGDDVIAYLAKNKLASESAKKIIISSDNDFYQLITSEDNVLVYDARLVSLDCP